MRLGICCIINELRDNNIYTGRTCQKSTYSIDKASELALQNSKDLLTCLQYCVNNNIRAFRVGSDFLPRMTEQHYAFTDLKDHVVIKNLLREAGKYAHQNDIILSCHPGPFTILGSLRDSVNMSGIAEVEYHSLIGDLLSQEVPDLQFAINFHVGCKYSPDVIPRFISSYNKLSNNAKSRITLENDDKNSCWSITKLMQIHELTGIPLVFDIHHSSFSREPEIDIVDEFNLAKSTWLHRNWMQEIHIAESADTNRNIPAHSDFIEQKIPDWLESEKNVYVLLEAKQKEKALFHYRSKYNIQY
jgi:UV DNA damage endonuclease